LEMLWEFIEIIMETSWKLIRNVMGLEWLLGGTLDNTQIVS
jgi:hypothetical protein